MAEEKKEKYVRPSWDEYFMGIMEMVSKRATCDRGRQAAIIVKDNQILVTGYVGSPVGLPHCDDVGHMMKEVHHEDGSVSNHCVRTLHAEQNAIAQAAKRGVAIDGGTMYCRMTPCRVCAAMLINCGIKRVVTQNKYHQGQTGLLEEAGLEVVVLKDELEEYEGMTEPASDKK
ncbi:cell division protein DedD [Candidatus Parcubacteria bacterium]|nr:MAG: cell division protein DedD [Candidatus Parcubacteria bacterium]